MLDASCRLVHDLRQQPGVADRYKGTAMECLTSSCRVALG
jgi:hypothetical protein